MSIVRQVPRNALAGFTANNYFTSAAGSGPPGSGTMTFFSIIQILGKWDGNFMAATGAGVGSIGGRYLPSAPDGGWGHHWTTVTGTNAIFVQIRTAAGVTNSIANFTLSSTAGIPYEQTIVLVCAMTDGGGGAGAGRITTWNNIQGQVANTSGLTFTYQTPPGTRAFSYGNQTANAWPATGVAVSDIGMLQGWDAVASYSNALYGTGIAGFGAQIVDDVRQGRPITWPRAAVANSDWYFYAADAVTAGGSTVLPTFTDRYTGTVLTRGGQLQGYSMTARV